MGKQHTKLGPVSGKEINPKKHVPYTCHVDPYTVVTENGDYIQVLKFQGVSFETADDELLATWHEQRNILLRSIAKGSVAFWTTIIREEKNRYPKGDFRKDGFGYQLNEKYKTKLANQKLYQNDLYISIILRDVGDLKLITGAKKLKKKVSKDDQNMAKRLKAINQLAKLTKKVKSSLGDYDPRLLSTYVHDGYVHSQVIEFFARLINGKFKRYPVTRKNIKDVLSAFRLSFGTETGEIRMTTGCKYFAGLGIKEYNASTYPGMLDKLLNLPMEYTLTQSFCFTNMQDAIGEIKLQRNRLVSAGDLSESQVLELDEALDDLGSGRIVAGYHHLNLIVFSPTLQALEDRLADADTALESAQLIVAREDLALEAAYWAQLPGNFSYRPRPAMITSKNFSGFFPLHNFPSGHIDGNHWGPAASMFLTTSQTAYFFNFHGRGSGKPPGNGVVVGPTGTGKTVVMLFMLSMAEKYEGIRVFFDKDYGAAIMVRAAGGIYLAIKKGVPTGFNPLQMDQTVVANVEFMKTLFVRIAERAGGQLKAEDEHDISEAIAGVLRMPLAQRNVTNMLAFLEGMRQDGPAERLRRWAAGGDRAWVFDNEQDDLNLNANYLGFDMTEVLDDDDLRTPIALYIVHRIKSLIDGTRIIINFDEGWKYARDPILGKDIEDFFRTIRKQEGLIIFGTNNPGDVGGDADDDSEQARIGKVILQQSQWQIYFPNQKARRKDYIDALDLTEKEFEIIRTLPVESRCFLIKRGVISTVVQLDLSEMDDELAVLSGTTGNVKLLDQIIDEVGNNPRDFLPEFHKRRKQVKKKEAA